jgi:hypothetical protein
LKKETLLVKVKLFRKSHDSRSLLFSKQITAIDRKAKAKDTKVLNEAKRNEKQVDFDSKGCGLSYKFMLLVPKFNWHKQQHH